MGMDQEDERQQGGMHAYSAATARALGEQGARRPVAALGLVPQQRRRRIFHTLEGAGAKGVAPAGLAFPKLAERPIRGRSVGGRGPGRLGAAAAAALQLPAKGPCVAIGVRVAGLRWERSGEQVCPAASLAAPLPKTPPPPHPVALERRGDGGRVVRPAGVRQRSHVQNQLSTTDIQGPGGTLGRFRAVGEWAKLARLAHALAGAGAPHSAGIVVIVGAATFQLAVPAGQHCRRGGGREGGSRSSDGGGGGAAASGGIWRRATPRSARSATLPSGRLSAWARPWARHRALGSGRGDGEAPAAPSWAETRPPTRSRGAARRSSMAEVVAQEAGREIEIQLRRGPAGAWQRRARMLRPHCAAPASFSALHTRLGKRVQNWQN